MINFIQFDSILVSNFFPFNFSGKYCLSVEKRDGGKRQKNVPVSARRVNLVLVFLLEVGDWLKCREEYDWLANDGG